MHKLYLKTDRKDNRIEVGFNVPVATVSRTSFGDLGFILDFKLASQNSTNSRNTYAK